MPRKRLNWLYNDERQEFVTPSGRIISLHEMVGLLEARLYCNIDFAGAWSGWKMRGNRLIPPGASMRGPAITATNAAAFARWLSGPDQAAAVPRRPPAGRPHLRLVYTSCR